MFTKPLIMVYIKTRSKERMDMWIEVENIVNDEKSNQT
jgi:hypothetical protein